MNAQDLSQRNSPPVGQDPASHVEDILANLADTGWLEKDSDVDAEGGTANGCPDSDSNQRRDVYDFDSQCPPEQPIFLEAKPFGRRRRHAERRPVATDHNNMQPKSKQAPTLAQRRRAYVLHDEDSNKEQQRQKDNQETTGKVAASDRHEPLNKCAAARTKDSTTMHNIGSLPLQQASAASQERQSSAKGLDHKDVSHGCGEPDNADHFPEPAAKPRRKRKVHKENTQEVIGDEVEDAGGPFPILPDFSIKNLAMLRPDVLLRPPEGRPIHRPVPTPDSLLLPLPSKDSTQPCARKKMATKLQAASQSSMLSLERSDRALAAEASIHCASRLPARPGGPGSTGTSDRQAAPDSCVSTHPLKRQDRHHAPYKLPAGTGFLRASELVPLSGNVHAAAPQPVHGPASVGHAASTAELKGISLAAPASVGAMGVNDVSPGADSSQEQQHPAAMQNQNRDQLGVFADCDSEDEDLDYSLLVAEAVGTCQQEPPPSQRILADPSSLPTVGGMQPQSTTCLPENAAPQTYGTETSGCTCMGCPTDVSLREAIRAPHPYETLASKAAAQLEDRVQGTNAPAGACRIVFAEEDESGQAIDEHWPRAGDWQQAAGQSVPQDKPRQAAASSWPLASALQLAKSQPTSAAVEGRVHHPQTEQPVTKEASKSGSSLQEPRRKKDLASFDLLDQLDFDWGGGAEAAERPVASIESGALSHMQWIEHGSRAAKGGSGADAEDRQCQIVFMDDEASPPAPALLTDHKRRTATAVGASNALARQMQHENGAVCQTNASRALNVDRWTSTCVPGQVATMDPAHNKPLSPCEIVFADCTD